MYYLMDAQAQAGLDRFARFQRMTDLMFVERVSQLGTHAFATELLPAFSAQDAAHLGLISIVLDFASSGQILTTPTIAEVFQAVMAQCQELTTCMSFALRPIITGSPTEGSQTVAQFMSQSPIVANAIATVRQATQTAVDEVMELLEKYAWLENIAKFASSWGPNSFESWRQISSNVYDMLSQLSDWCSKLLVVKPLYQVSSSVVLLDCKVVASKILPKLAFITQDLDALLTETMSNLCTELVSDLAAEISPLRGYIKTTDFATTEFLAFVLKLNSAHTQRMALQERITSMQALFAERRRIEYLLKSGVSVRGRLMGQHDAVMAEWKVLQDLLDTCSERAKILGPLMCTKILTSLDVLEAAAVTTLGKLSAENFTDVTASCESNLSLLRAYGQHLEDLHAKATELSFVLESITNVAQTQPTIAQALKLHSIRTKIWELVQSSEHNVAAWLTSSFMEVDIDAISTALTKWQTDIVAVRADVEDSVVLQLQQRVQSLLAFCPALRALKHSALKRRHWKSLFVLFGKPSDTANESVTVKVLLELNISAFLPSIDNICAVAEAELALQAELAEITAFWTELTIPFTPRDLPRLVRQSATDTLPSKVTPVQRWKNAISQVKNSRRASTQRGTTLIFELLRAMAESTTVFVFDAASSFFARLEDAIVRLRVMLDSPVLNDEHRRRAEQLMQDMVAVRAIMERWRDAQETWMFCNYIVCHLSKNAEMSTEVNTFFEADKRFRGILRNVDNQPLASALLGSIRAPATRREYQGEQLRASFDLLGNQLETVRSHLVDIKLAPMRTEFPRFGLLEDSALITLIADSSLAIGSPSQQVLRRCFMGVAHLLSSSQTSCNPLETERITGLRGVDGFSLPFKAPVTIVSDKFLWELWMSESILAMKSSMTSLFDRAYSAYPARLNAELSSERLLAFVREFGAQQTVLVNQVVFDEAVSTALSSQSHDVTAQLENVSVWSIVILFLLIIINTYVCAFRIGKSSCFHPFPSLSNQLVLHPSSVINCSCCSFLSRTRQKKRRICKHWHARVRQKR